MANSVTVAPAGIGGRGFGTGGVARERASQTDVIAASRPCPITGKPVVEPEKPSIRVIASLNSACVRAFPPGRATWSSS